MQPGRQGQPERSKPDAHEDFVLGPVEEIKDIALAEIAERLAEERGVSAGPATLVLLRQARNHVQKKTAHASEQRSDVKAARRAWFEGQPDLDPERRATKLRRSSITELSFHGIRTSP
jgi:hypothetical protein